jgi:hypothetical protein
MKTEIDLPVAWKDKEKLCVPDIGERLLDIIAAIAEASDTLTVSGLKYNRRITKTTRLLDYAGETAIDCLQLIVNKEASR